MRRKTTRVQLLWHVAGVIHHVSEAITRVQTDNYAEALHHAIKAGGHLCSLVMARETIKSAGGLLSIRIKQLASRLLHQLRRHIRNQQSRHDDDR